MPDWTTCLFIERRGNMCKNEEKRKEKKKKKKRIRKRKESKS